MNFEQSSSTAFVETRAGSTDAANDQARPDVGHDHVRTASVSGDAGSGYFSSHRDHATSESEPHSTASDPSHQLYAQATTPSPSSSPQVIGRVEKVTGTATALRAGVQVALKEQDPIFKDDVLQTAGASTLGISFVDGTAFNLSRGAQLAVNDILFDPANNSGNSGLLTLTQGAMTVIAGKIAKTGDLHVNTPAATLGIRGTTGFSMVSNTGTARFSLIPDVDTGHIGQLEVIDRVTGERLYNLIRTDAAVVVTPGGGAASTVTTRQLSETEQQGLGQQAQETFNIYSRGLQHWDDRTPTNPAPTDQDNIFRRGNGNPGSDGRPQPVAPETPNPGILTPIPQKFTTPDSDSGSHPNEPMLIQELTTPINFIPQIAPSFVAPTTLISPITPNGILNAVNASRALTIAGTSSATGGSVEVTLNGVQYQANVGADGSWSVTLPQTDVARLVDGQTYPVTALVTDQYGNVGATPAQQTLAVHETLPTATIATTGGDGVLNSAEGQQALTIAGSSSATGGFVEVTLNGVHYQAAVGADGSWSVTLPKADIAKLVDGQSYSVTALVTDQYGNVAATPAQQALAVHEALPTATIAAIVGDGVLNFAEGQQALTIAGSSSATGGSVDVTLNGVHYHGVVGADGSWSVTLPQTDVAKLADGQSYPVTALITDQYGNVGATPAQQTLAVHETLPIAIIATIAGDGVLNCDEGHQALTIAGSSSATGGSVDVTLNGQHYQATVGADGSWTVTLPQADVAKLADGQSYPVTALITDQYGNVAATPAQQTLAVHESLPTAHIATIAGDGVLNCEEGHQALAITGSSSATGGSVDVTLNGVHYLAVVGADGSWAVTLPQTDVAKLADGHSYSVTALVTDQYGNVGATPAQQTLAVHETLPTAHIATIAGDGALNSSEGQHALTIAGSSTATGGFVDVTLNGGHYHGAVGADGAWSVTLPQTDAATLAYYHSYYLPDLLTFQTRNFSDPPAQQTLAVHESLPSVTIATIAGDGALNSTEGYHPLTIAGSTSATGGTVDVTLNGAHYNGAVGAGGAWSVTLPQADIANLSNGHSYSVAALVTDQYGNVSSAPAQQTISVHETLPTATIATIAGDDALNYTEAHHALTICGSSTATGGFIDVTLNGLHYYGAIGANGAWSVTLPQSDVAMLAEGHSYKVTALATDQYGNVGATPAQRTLSNYDDDDHHHHGSAQISAAVLATSPLAASASSNPGIVGDGPAYSGGGVTFAQSTVQQVQSYSNSTFDAISTGRLTGEHSGNQISSEFSNFAPWRHGHDWGFEPPSAAHDHDWSIAENNVGADHTKALVELAHLNHAQDHLHLA